MTPFQPEISTTTAAKGYWIVLATVQEPLHFGRYTSVAGPLIATYGGRVLARGDVVRVVEGSVPGRPYVIEFPSYAQAQACFDSPGYQDAISLRAGVAEFHIVVVEGLASKISSPSSSTLP
jgi:uncharacterized protein (DUF1330 family)